jgi:Icc-related predicted phosphoesterase
MKILALGDIHADKALTKKQAARAKKEKVDLVILCGDLTRGEQSTEGIIGPFVKNNLKVVLIPGNHETIATADFLAELYNVTNLHAYSIKYKNIGLFGCGGADIGLSQLSDKDIFNSLKKGFRNIKNLKKKIMVTHMHPKDTKSEFSGFKGSEGIKKAIEKFKPDFALFSHIHEGEGLEEKIGKTKLINVGRKGVILEI